MKLVVPGIYQQVATLGLRVIVCECNCPVFAAGMHMTEAYVQFTCIACGISSAKMKVDSEKSSTVESKSNALTESN